MAGFSGYGPKSRTTIFEIFGFLPTKTVSSTFLVSFGTFWLVFEKFRPDFGGHMSKKCPKIPKSKGKSWKIAKNDDFSGCSAIKSGPISPKIDENNLKKLLKVAQWVSTAYKWKTQKLVCREFGSYYEFPNLHGFFWCKIFNF